MKQRCGHPKKIDDATLQGVRDYLVWLLETTWADVGCKLRLIRSSAEVQSALSTWERYRKNNYAVDTLLRSSETRATPKIMSEIRRRLVKLNHSIRAAYVYQERCRDFLVHAERALGGQLSKIEREISEQKRVASSEALTWAESKRQNLENRRGELEAKLRSCEAFFARAEVVHFCRSRHYSLTPLNIANALAGIPFIGWRQSFKRCAPWHCSNANSYRFQVFNVFCRIVNSCSRRSKLVNHAEQWLRARTANESDAIKDLQQNWYHVRGSLDEVLKTKLLSRELPYAMLGEYLKRKAESSAADLVTEKEEQIVP